MPEFDHAGDYLALGVTLDQLEAPVRVQCQANVEAFLGTEVPRATGDRFGVYEDPATNWAYRGLVEIKRALEEFPCRHPRIECRLLE
jgi:hypothetical protein